MKPIIALLSLALAVNHVAAQSTLPRFEFKGIQFGDSLPRSKGFLRGNGLGCHEDKQVASSQFCSDYAIDARLANVPVGSQFRRYLDGRLIELGMPFNSEKYDEITEVLTARYGEPASTVRDQIQNRLGANFTNETKKWPFADGELALERYGDSVTDGDMTATSTDGMADFAKRKKAAVLEAAAKDLGPIKH